MDVGGYKAIVDHFHKGSPLGKAGFSTSVLRSLLPTRTLLWVRATRLTSLNSSQHKTNKSLNDINNLSIAHRP